MKDKNSLRVAIAQVNSTVGDLHGNAVKISRYIEEAKNYGTDIICFPELALCGYPPEDLLLKPKFISDNVNILKNLTKTINGDIVAVVGFADGEFKKAYNAAAIIHNGQIKGVYRKNFLPNYGVFDEQRYFSSGDKSLVFGLSDFIFGVNICEDIWHPEGPTKSQAAAGSKLILNINASPYYATKFKERQAVIAKQAKTNDVFVVYANLVGGQDELIFDGQSMIVDNKGRILARAKAFAEDLLIRDLGIPVSRLKHPKKVIKIANLLSTPKTGLVIPQKPKVLEPVAEVYQALVLGVKDYVVKNGFQKAVIGLSGGIDSSLVGALAVDALGNENVTGVFMPSRYTCSQSQEDATALAKNLGIKFVTISIEPIFRFYLLVLEPHFAGLGRDTAEENLQARIRGNIMMAFSNKFGWLVLATGNKSEMSTGYATLYGDMAGGLAVIKDVPKTLVYKLAVYRNSLHQVIPERVFTKAPTAELKPNQLDQDTLPPYEILDAILKAYVEEDKSLAKIISLGFDKEIVNKTIGMVDKNEYKRRQSPPGIKITPKAFGRDRRMPITNKYCG
ncbi:MAG: NAD+ synthase [Candidatus Omnitrophica bacterium]|nr:NAD+ synthase [Candidatus Omnitrophota bacterium]MDD5690374.1 NAD+ synthase [Candidatus Omnitrophota bacterium]